MQIILDANVYATDYRMKGVSFRTLFEYLRRTDSRIVLPRSIREEVILSYGRRLKAEAKEFAEVWNRYRYLELDYDRGLFDKPDVGDAQKALRRILRKPFGGIPTIFVAQMEGVSVEEVFIRGARRKRPANEQGEELRDVIIWLWVLSYSDTAGTQVAFISGDSGFWAKDAPHPDIQHDLQSKGGRVSIYKTIDDFIKSHAPAPTPVTAEWVEEHLPIQTIEPELLQKVSADLAKELRAIIRDLTLEHSELTGGTLFQIASDTEFAELQFKFAFRFNALLDRPGQMWASGFGRMGGILASAALDPRQPYPPSLAL